MSTIEEEEELVFHINGDNLEPIPVFTKDQPPMDGAATLENTLTCPVKYLCKINPTMVVDNFCFILDGDAVPVEPIVADHTFWKQTSSSSRFFFSETLRTYHQVTLLSWKGSAKGAYRRKKIKGGGLMRVDLERVFKVTRHFSYWRSCKGFHRIISVVVPLNKEGEQWCGFQSRVFVQYFWRSDKKSDKDRVLKEYLSHYGRRETGIGGSMSPNGITSAENSAGPSVNQSARNSVQLPRPSNFTSMSKRSTIVRPTFHPETPADLSKKRKTLAHL